MPARTPEHVIPRPDHAFQRTLDLLDAGLRLHWNGKLKRFEIWQATLGERAGEVAVFYDFVIRVEDQGRFAEPGNWLLEKLRRRDARYAGPKEAAQTAIAEMDAHNEQLDEEKRRKNREAIAAVAHDGANVIGREVMDDPLFGKPFTVPDKYPEPAAAESA